MNFVSRNLREVYQYISTPYYVNIQILVSEIVFALIVSTNVMSFKSFLGF